MPRKAAKLEETANFRITFRMTQKKKSKERGILFKKMKSLISRDEKLFPTRGISFSKREISLESDEFAALIYFDKPISMYITIGKDFEKNKNRVNDLGNRLVNYFNIILGESAKDATIFTSFVSIRRKGMNLARKFVEDTRLAKINELTKKSLNPAGIMFEYKSDKHENTVMHFYAQKASIMGLISNSRYKDTIPWDFTIGEYNNVKESIRIIEKLDQKEF